MNPMTHEIIIGTNTNTNGNIKRNATGLFTSSKARMLSNIGFTVILLVLFGFQTSSATVRKKVVLTNDDGWAVAIVRAQNSALKEAGFDVRVTFHLRSMWLNGNRSFFPVLPKMNLAQVRLAHRQRYSSSPANLIRVRSPLPPKGSMHLTVCAHLFSTFLLG